MDAWDAQTMETAIAETWRVLRLGGSWIELAAFDCGDIAENDEGRRWPSIRGHAVRYVRSADGALEAATPATSLGQRGFYVVPARLVAGREAVYDANVWSCAHNGTAKESDVTWSAVLCVDADPKRPANTSATKEQWAAAVGVAGVVRETLMGAGVPDVALGTGHSGNGAHVHIYLDVEWSPEVKTLRERVLRALGVLCHYVSGPSTRVSIDQTLADGARYIPLYGTLKRKGGRGHADRPWRKTALVGPAVVSPLDIVGLRGLADALEAKLTPAGIEFWEKEWKRESKKAPTTNPGKNARSAASSKGTSSSVYDDVNKLPMRDVGTYVGIDLTKCSRCGSEKGAGITKHPADAIDIFHCFHDSCSAKPNLTNTALILLAKGVAEGDKKGTFDAVADVARHFGIAVPKLRATKAAKPSKEERAAAFAAVMAAVLGEVDATAATPPGGATSTHKAPEADPQDAARVESAGECGEDGTTTNGGTTAAACGSDGAPGDHPGEPTSPRTEVDYDALLEAALGLDAIQQEAVIEAVAKRCGISKGVLRKRLAELEEEREGDDAGRGAKADVLAEVLEEVDFVRGAESRPYGRFGSEAVPVDSAQFTAKIAHEYRERAGGYVSASTIETAILPILGGEVRRAVVPIRFAYDEDSSIWIDLGDAKRQFVHITKEQVKPETTCPIAFRRPCGMKALPAPVVPDGDAACGATMTSYMEFLALKREQFAAVFAWQVGGMRPMEVPVQDEGEFTEYVILKLIGPEGSGKTLAADYIRSPVDPKSPMHVALPQKVEDINISGENARVLAYDNSSYIGQERSDALCRRATGDGSEVRALYTARDQTVTVGSNPIIITSIADAVTEADLLSRCLSLDLPKRDKRRTKNALKAEFKSLYPKIFGALCYCISRALKNLDTTEVPDTVRMQDAAQWALAAASAAGLTRDEVLAAFTASVEQADALIMENPIVAALLVVVKPGTTWSGTSGDLLARVTEAHESRIPATGTPTKKVPKGWPDKPETLRSRLSKLVPTLARAGVTIEWPKGGGRKGRLLTVTRAAEVVAEGAESITPPVDLTGMSVDEDDGIEGMLAEWERSGNGSGTVAEVPTVPPEPPENGCGNGGTVGTVPPSPAEEGKRERGETGVVPGWATGSACSLVAPKEGCERTVPTVPPFPAREDGAAAAERSGGTVATGNRSDDAVGERPVGAPLRARAVWATYDGALLTVALVPVEEAGKAEPHMFDFRLRDEAEAHTILTQIYGWSGWSQAGIFADFTGEVRVTTRPHSFEDGTQGSLVSTCLRLSDRAS